MWQFCKPLRSPSGGITRSELHHFDFAVRCARQLSAQRHSTLAKIDLGEHHSNFDLGRDASTGKRHVTKADSGRTVTISKSRER